MSYVWLFCLLMLSNVLRTATIAMQRRGRACYRSVLCYLQCVEVIDVSVFCGFGVSVD